MPFLLLFFSLPADGQDVASTLRVDLNDCRNPEYQLLFKDPDLKLYRLPAKTLAYQFSFGDANPDSAYA